MKPWEIADKLDKSNVLIHKYLKTLIEQWVVQKNSNWPHSTYGLMSMSDDKKGSSMSTNDVDIKQHIDTYFFWYENDKILDQEFYKFTAYWDILIGKKWFIHWCKQRKLDVVTKAKDFIAIYTHIKKHQNECWVLDATENFSKNLVGCVMNKVYFADQYKRMDFWRWKLAEVTFFAKQSQQKTLLFEAIDAIMPKLECLIHTQKFDAIAITPHSIKRANQLLLFLQKKLSFLSLPFVELLKYYPHNIAIPQKSLKTRDQRIENARRTILLQQEKLSYKKVLLIDDFVWSWATLNETAKKLLASWVEQVTWFAFVWNTNLQYDVIHEI